MAISAPVLCGSAIADVDAATLAVTLDTAVAQNDIIVVRTASGTDSTIVDATVASIADDGGNTYAIHVNEVRSSRYHCGIATAKAAAALGIGDTVTVTFTTSCEDRVVVVEKVSGADLTDWFDQAAPGNGGTSTLALGPTGTLEQAAELAIAAFCIAENLAGATFTADTAGGWTALTEVSNEDGSSTNTRRSAAQYKIVAATTAISTTAALSSAEQWAGGIITLKEATGGGGSAPANTVAPAVTGTETQGEQLSTTDGTWTNEPDSFTYQWQRDNSGGGSYSNIGGATASTYTLTGTDAGCNVRCVVTATNATGSASANSNGAGLIGPLFTSPPAGTGRVEVCGNAVVEYTAPPINTAAPAITGSPAIDETLSVDTGTWDNSPDSFTYQWQISDDGSTGWANVDGETDSSYLIVAGDATKFLRCQVAAANEQGSTTADSDVAGPVGSAVPVNSVAPAITGSQVEGATLTVSDGTWTNDPDSFTYDWEKADDEAFTTNVTNVGTDQDTYLVQAADEDKWIRCNVTASNSFGAGDPEASNVVEIDTPVPTSSVAPVASGVTRVDRSVSATTGTWTGTPTSYAYQWEVADDETFETNAGDITDATSSSYVLTEDELDKYVRCVVTATNAGGSGTETASNELGPVEEAAVLTGYRHHDTDLALILVGDLFF